MEVNLDFGESTMIKIIIIYLPFIVHLWDILNFQNHKFIQEIIFQKIFKKKIKFLTFL